jgi:hypothetical protein
MEAFLVRKYAILVTLLLLIVLVFFWVESAKSHQSRLNNLYINGLKAVGRVTDVIVNRKNSANMSSWEVYYYYWDMDSIRRTGKISESYKRTIPIGELVYVQYLKIDSKFHVASLSKTNYKPIGLLSAMFTFGHVLLIVPIFVIGIIILTQTLYLFKGNPLAK